ncbi:O-antigen ligase family protein [Shewanella algae]|uniref:O-antigen ligase family protein n=1 Tax=Shewanella algae TaxID=38313 RepID=UPI000BB617F5|nr:O-antigen ligase family protein [Shewanella algae]
MRISNNFKSTFGSIFIFGTWPPISMAYISIGFLIGMLKAKFKYVKKIHFISVVFMSIIALTCFVTSYSLTGNGDYRDLKFVFYILALTIGFSVKVENVPLLFRWVFFVYCILLLMQNYFFGWGSESRENGLFYLPDQNNSMIIISFLYPAVVFSYSAFNKVLISFFAIMVMYIIGSRAGMGIIFLSTMLSIFTQLKFKNTLLVAAIFLLPIVSLISNDVLDFSSFYEFNNYSDQVRLVLWSVGLENFLSSSNYFIGLGYDFPTIYADFLKSEMKHVHNIYIQVLLTSGIIGFISIVFFFISWLIFSYKQGNKILFLQVSIVMILGCIETLYSDSRVFSLICFCCGLSYVNYKCISEKQNRIFSCREAL